MMGLKGIIDNKRLVIRLLPFSSSSQRRSVFFLRRGWKKMEAALGLLRRMPPKQSETALSALLSLIPQHSSDLLSQVDLPLQVFSIFIEIWKCDFVALVVLISQCLVWWCNDRCYVILKVGKISSCVSIIEMQIPTGTFLLYFIV